MHDTVAFLKDAVQRGLGSGVNGCYVVRDGNIYARKMGLQAGIAWDAGADFTISADALDAALARMKEVDSLSIEDDCVIVKGGRLRSTIRREFQEAPPVAPMPTFWIPSPPGLSATLKRAKAFCGDQKFWSKGVRIMDGRVTALSGFGGIDVEVDGLEAPPSLLTTETVDFLAAQGDPDEYSPDKNHIVFRWEDGRWLRANFIDDEMPEAIIQKLFNSVGEEAPIEVSDTWREALADAAALSDSKVKLIQEGFVGRKGDAVNDVSFDTGLPEGHESHWRSADLARTFDNATAWNPAAWPKPAYFVGEGLRGIVASFQE